MVHVEVGKEPPRTFIEMIHVGLQVIAAHLPPSWSTEVRLNPSIASSAGDELEGDAEVTLRAPDGQTIILIIDVKLGEFRAPEALRVARRLDRYSRERGVQSSRAQSSAVPVLFARYLTRPTRKQLGDLGLGYVDATGNMLLRSDDPPLLIADRGEDRDPWRVRSGRPHRELAGEPAAKVVRALADIRGPWKVRDLIDRAEVSTGALYRILEFLEERELLERQGSRGPISVPDWQALLRLWSDDYQFLHANRISRWIAPRGLDYVMDRMRKTARVDCALTGSIAASEWAPYAPVRSAMVYAPDPGAVAEDWDLRPTDSGANVFLAQPIYAVALDRAVEALGGLRVASPAQVAVDLMTGPGRAPAEADELLEWMGKHEQAWRLPQ
ncbi:hypothetical protein [Nocardia fluminea]|uniref:hypothetical protein n=1 Tax=Nocardia fluminea TaxID=134984 RepID=UPI0033EF4D44